jgi:hypothetical protein
VYDHPRDFPENYVARLFMVDAGGAHATDTIVIGGLDVIRERMRRRGLSCLPRAFEDDSRIIETWI